MAMLPKTSSKAPSASAISPGSLVTYEHERGFFLATVLGNVKENFKLLNMRGRTLDLPASRLHLLPGKIPSQLALEAERTQYLLKLFDETAAKADEIPLEEIWGFVQNENREYRTDELCTIYFGENSLEKHLTLRQALLKDPLYFKRKKDQFEPRSASTVQELKLALEARKKITAKLNATSEFLMGCIKRSAWSEPPPQARDHIDLLSRLAAGDTLEEGRGKEVKELVDIIAAGLSHTPQGNKQGQAYDLLQQAGLFHPNTNLSFFRHGLPGPYSDQAMREAEAIHPAESGAMPEQVLDLTDLEAITIDDESTRDMDDALSIVQSESGYTLGIHISDVAAYIPIDSVLDREARERATSLYPPEHTIHMLPTVLAEDRLSLVVGQARRCVSCLCSLSPNFEIKSFEFRPTLIRVVKKWSYDQVEQILSDEGHHGSEYHTLNLLYEVSTALEADRIAHGALRIPKRVVQVQLTDPSDMRKTDLYLKEIDENGPSRALVGEMMVLMNSLLARWVRKEKIPFIYRSQEPSDSDTGAIPSHIPEGPARDYVMRGGLKRSLMSTTPGPHATLGIAEYTQSTSPIRRYLDLCNQRQVNAALLGKTPPYSADQLTELIEATENALSRSQAIAKETHRFWILKYLERKFRKKESIVGTVLRTDMKHPLAELDEVFINAPVRTSRAVRAGDVLKLTISAVDPKSDYLRIEELS